MPACANCRTDYPFLADSLSFCPSCLRNSWEDIKAYVEEVHRQARRAFLLPDTPPRSPDGKLCGWCGHNCRLGEGEVGFCGLRKVENGSFIHLAGTKDSGLLHWYRDPLPTNCVADWVCDGSKMLGYHNLAVFYGSCTFNCLFCQNWHYREMSKDLIRRGQGRAPDSRGNLISAEELASVANERTFCICFFGGDPSSQMPHALSTARRLATRGVRICWETNGSMNRKFLREAVKLSLDTGGTMKFDLKAWSEGIHFALTGADNRQTLENFEFAAGYISARQSPPLLVASTLLVPPYIDEIEVSKISSFIAKLSPDIPYALLAFYPEFLMSDLPRTSRRQAEEAFKIAKSAGLKNVRLGNVHLLG